MQKVFDFFSSSLAKFTGLAEWLILLVKQVFLDVWAFVTDIFCWFFEGILAIAIGALNAIDIPFNPQTYYSLIPPDVAAVLGYTGVPQALTIIGGALIVRFLLQTIPFVRWGS